MTFGWGAVERNGLSLGRAIGSAVPSGRQWRAWAGAEPELASLRGVSGLVTELAASPAARQDALLAAVLRLAQRGPHADAAFAVLLRCLWPGVAHRIRAYGPPLDTDEAAAIVGAALVEAVAGYDLASGGRFVANRLLAAPTRRLWRAARKARDANGHGDPLAEATDPAPHDGGGGGVGGLSGLGLVRLAVDAGVLAPADAWLVYATRLAGLPLTEAAGLLGLDYSAAWRRRRRAEHRWAAWWAPDHPGRTGGQGAR